MTDPTSHPGTPDGSWTPGSGSSAATGWAPQQDAPAPAEKKGLKKLLPYVGAIAGAGILGVSALNGGFFGFNATEVGDCVKSTGETAFEVVDCGSDDAESRVVGIEDKEVNYDQFMADDSLCASFEKTEYLIWEGELESEPGTVYCTEPV